MKRFMAWLLILVLMVPAAALAEGVPMASGTLVYGAGAAQDVAAEPVVVPVESYSSAETSYVEVAAPAASEIITTMMETYEAPAAATVSAGGMPEIDVPTETDSGIIIDPTPAPYVPVPTAVPTSNVTRTLSYGMSGNDVLTVQTQLRALGYYWGDLNGEFGSSLVTAVRNFQAAWNVNNPSRMPLTVDGIVGPSTRAAIFSGYVEPAVTAPANTFTLQKGMSGEEVLAAQKRLNQLGYYMGELNGEFNDSVEYAVRLFQAKNEITVDGKIGYITRSLLYSSEAIAADIPDYNLSNLSIGMSGEAVKELQRQLRQTFYYSGLIDGIFGKAVENAVKAFQASAGLSVDGKVGSRTFDALFNRKASIFNGGIPVRTLSKGSRGYDVKVLQDKLINLNYTFDAWYEEGLFDDSTVAVVKRFQQRNDLKVTGIFDSTMRRYLWPTTVEAEENLAHSYEGTPDDPYVGRTLRLHSYGEDVKALQMKLLATGYMVGNADGIYGALTKAAVLRFQKAYSAVYGLKPDGVVGPKTWAAINTVLNSNGAEQTIVDYRTTAVGAYNRTLRIGSYGNDVKKLQQALKNLGYDPGNVDGIYGVKTFAAVRQFQFYNNLVADGVAGPQTYIVLHWAD